VPGARGVFLQHFFELLERSHLDQRLVELVLQGLIREGLDEVLHGLIALAHRKRVDGRVSLHRALELAGSELLGQGHDFAGRRVVVVPDGVEARRERLDEALQVRLSHRSIL